MSSALMYIFILIISALIPFLFYVAHKRSTHELAINERSLLATNLGFFNGLYAFLLGFAVVTLWTQFIKAEDSVTSEAMTINNIYRLSLVMPRTEDLRSALLRYNLSIINDEWKAMDRNSTFSEKTQELYQEVWYRAYKLKPKGTADELTFSNMATRLQELSQYRLQRILLLSGRLYPLIWSIIILGAVFAISSFYFISTDKHKVQFYFDFIFICMTFLCIWLISELNTPFSGSINVSSRPFTIVQERMDTMNATIEHFETLDRQKIFPPPVEKPTTTRSSPAPKQEELQPFR